MHLDATIQRLAAKHYGLVTRQELHPLGVSADQIKRRLRAGLLIRVQPGSTPCPGRRDVRAAGHGRMPGCGPRCGGVASQRGPGLGAAGREQQRVESPFPVRQPRLVGAAVHRSLILAPVDIRVHQGITVTRPERTLVDVAGVVPIDVATSMSRAPSTWGSPHPSTSGATSAGTAGRGVGGAECGRSSRRGGRRLGRPRAGWRTSPCGRSSATGRGRPCASTSSTYPDGRRSGSTWPIRRR